MNLTRHIFVINPAAGKGQEAKRTAEAVRDACAAAGEEFEIYSTTAPGDATEYVRNSIQKKPPGEVWRFYACGGDGTLCEVVGGAANPNALSHPGPLPGVEVGCVPVGTGNDFVRNFTQPDFFRDITKQLLADAIDIDAYACRCGGEAERLGVNMINIGFDCDVVVKTAELKKKSLMPKSLAYLAGIAVTFRKNLGKTIRVIRSDGSELRREFQLVSAANGGWCGGGFHSAPKSSLSDGMLDISLIKKVSRTTFLRLVGAYKKGTHLDTRLGKRLVAYYQDKSVAFDMGEETDVCIDGEIVRTKELSLSVLPRAIAFAVPVGCQYLAPQGS